MFLCTLNSSLVPFLDELRINDLPVFKQTPFLCCLRFSVSDVVGKKPIPSFQPPVGPSRESLSHFILQQLPGSQGAFRIATVLSILFAPSLTHVQFKKSNWNYSFSPCRVFVVWTGKHLERKFLLISYRNARQSLEKSVNFVGVHLLLSRCSWLITGTEVWARISFLPLQPKQLLLQFTPLALPVR